MARVTKEGARESVPRNPADDADDRATARAVKMMIEGPLSSWNVSRPISSLNKADLHKLAVAAISGYVLQRAQDKLSCLEYDPISDALAAMHSSDQTP